MAIRGKVTGRGRKRREADAPAEEECTRWSSSRDIKHAYCTWRSRQTERLSVGTGAWEAGDRVGGEREGQGGTGC
eukprot:106675-Hanusia_phi.AAC.1